MCNIIRESGTNKTDGYANKAHYSFRERKDSVIEGHWTKEHYSYRKEKDFIAKGNAQQRMVIFPLET